MFGGYLYLISNYIPEFMGLYLTTRCEFNPSFGFLHFHLFIFSEITTYQVVNKPFQLNNWHYLKAQSAGLEEALTYVYIWVLE